MRFIIKDYFVKWKLNKININGVYKIYVRIIIIN